MTKTQPDDLEAVRKVVEALGGFEPREQERILRWAREKAGLGPESQQPGSTRGLPSAPLADSPAAPPTRTGADIKSFCDEKNPRSDTQFVATVAYYYRFEAPEELQKESITAEDLQEACRLVNRGRLQKPAQTLINALAQGVVDRGERGAYTINTVGENLVAMALPGEAGRVAARKSTRRPSPKRATSSKKKRTRGARR